MQTPALEFRQGRTRKGSRPKAALRQLGWPHYWLLVSILASGLLFFVLILLMTYPGQ
ncbi:MAG TPA: hypothetical protein VE379_02525 [Vicinamibacterales bacterium]|jgi:hypothetical protein|nr:hypothetical protein [Vicinamibacterales bacterium]